MNRRLLILAGTTFSVALLATVLLLNIPASPSSTIGQTEKLARIQKPSDAKKAFPKKHAEIQRLRRTPADRTSPEYENNYLINEYEKAKSNSSKARARVESDLEFIERGPANIAGRTRGLIVDPSDASENTWIAGSASGGIWKTEDAGVTWTNLSNDMPNLGTGAIVMSPANADVIYAGTGEHYISDIDGNGIFKSTDKGATWVQVASPDDYPDLKNVGRMIIDPEDENVVVAVTRNSVWAGSLESAIYKTTDGGTTWVQKSSSTSARFDDINFEPGNFDVQYAAAENDGVYKSIDAGETWTRSSTGLIASGRLEIDVSTVNTDFIWLSAEGSGQAQLYLSRNGAETWSIVSDNTFPDEDLAETFDFLQQGWYDNIIAAHPFDSNIVYVGGVDLWKFTLDGGSSTFNFISRTEDNTDSFMEFISFIGSDDGFTIGEIGYAGARNVELRFGQGTQKAHRFHTDGQGAGVPTNEYLYQDYVDVPFQAWDVANNTQLMVSFRDQQQDGKWNLISANTTGEETSEHSREYVYIHDVEYSDTPDTAIAVDGGHEHDQMYNFWPVLATGGSFDENNLPVANLEIFVIELDALSRSTFNISDSRGQFDGNNANIQSPPRTEDGVHPDHHNIIAIAKNAQTKEFRMLNANDGGVYLSKLSDDPGVADMDYFYTSLGYNTTQFYGADKAPGENRYLGGMQDNGTFVSPMDESASATSYYNYAIGGDGFEVLWNNRDPLELIGGYYNNNFFKSSDGGETWNYVGLNDGPFLSRLANSRELPDRIFAIAGSGVYVSNNFGEDWTLTEIDDELWSYNSAADIKVSHASSEVIWAGGYMQSNGRIFVSTDGGASFRPTSNYIGTSLGFISGLGSHPNDPETAYALFSFAGRPKVVKTEDLGETWTDISGFEGNNGVSDRGFPDVAVNHLLVFPNDPNRIWVGSEIGIIESLDAGANWSLLDSNFPAVNVHQLKIQDDQIVIATYGRGIWSVTIPEIEQDYYFPPTAENVTFSTSDGSIGFDLSFQAEFDSTEIYVDSVIVTTLYSPELGSVTHTIPNLGLEGVYSVTMRSYADGKAYNSLPSEAFFFVPDESRTSYMTHFSENEADFANLGFEFKKERNFDDTAVHSPHDYPNDSEFIFLLKSPIEVAASDAFIKYTDVAIIEPGENGFPYPAQEFWDYIVVEGSTDGSTWTALDKGYDARKHDDWLAAYATGDDGSQSLMRDEELDLLDTFDPGDLVYIRFRMYTDAAVTGWGWAMDDLFIQEEPEQPLGLPSTAQLQVFPNPMTTQCEIQFAAEFGNGTRLRLIDLQGKTLRQWAPDNTSGSITLAREGLNPGVYLLLLNHAEGVVTRKLIID